MATASALEGLPPMQRADSMAKKMTKMFKKPDAHAAFLTSSRFALDLIKVGGARKTHGLPPYPQISKTYIGRILVHEPFPAGYASTARKGEALASCSAKAKV